MLTFPKLLNRLRRSIVDVKATGFEQMSRTLDRQDLGNEAAEETTQEGGRLSACSFVEDQSIVFLKVTAALAGVPHRGFSGFPY